jgi:hypothetical protein
METTALLLIIVTLFLLVIIVGLLTLLVYKLMKQPPLVAPTLQKETGEAPHPDISKSEFHPAILDRMKEMDKLRPKKADIYCVNHSEEPGEATCAICEKIFCKACIKPFKTLHFCREHISIIMRNEWIEVFTLKTSTQEPEDGVILYAEKKKLFEEEDIPTYIETHYKINVDHDFIETYLVVFAMKEHKAAVKIHLMKQA